MILRFLYICLTYLLIPVVLLHLFRKGFGNRDYWHRIGERFGFFPGQNLDGAIWVHAVSVGEVQAAASLVRRLLRTYPERALVLTTTTPTGSDRARALFGDQVVHCYAPFDMAWPVKRFFNWCRPEIAIILETELWPNLYHACGSRKVPLVLASARISRKSVRRYRWVLSLFRETLSHGIVIAAQTSADARRFVTLGASSDRTHVTGNIKFDFELPAGVADLGREFRAAHAAERPVWVAASTHVNEEEITLAAHRIIQKQFPDALLLLVPRHPERFDSIAALLKRQGFAYVRRSSGLICDADSAVFLGDSMGELTTFYAAADIAFVGGSLVKIGGHNLLEPAALRLPIITGPYTYNAEGIVELFQENGLAQVVWDAESLATAVTALMADPDERKRLGDGSEALINSSRGALERLMKLLAPLLS
jgi:3-deoxy-D-manno-octulosonic-acid transferase